MGLGGWWLGLGRGGLCLGGSWLALREWLLLGGWSRSGNLCWVRLLLELRCLRLQVTELGLVQ